MQQTDREIAETQTEFVSLLKELTSDDEETMASINRFISMLDKN